jgi:hypothetical protein
LTGSRGGGGTVAGGGKVQATETAQRLQISWQVRQLPREYRDGYGATALPLAALFDRSDLPGKREVKPAMVYFSRLTLDEKGEKRMFDSMEVAVAARWFDCVRIYVDDIEDKAAREEWSKSSSIIVFLDGSGKEVTRLAGNSVTASAVYSAMQKAAAPDFKNPLPAMVDKYSAFLRKFDKIQSKVTGLEADIQDDIAHIAKHDCAPGRRRLKENEDELKPLRNERDKLLEDEKVLLKPELKPKG